MDLNPMVYNLILSLYKVPYFCIVSFFTSHHLMSSVRDIMDKKSQEKNATTQLITTL